MTTPIHFRVPDGMRAGPDLSRYLAARGVSMLWFGIEGGSGGEALPPASAPKLTLPSIPGFPPHVLAHGLAHGLAYGPPYGPAARFERAFQIESPRDVLLEVPIADWAGGAWSGAVDEIGRATDALVGRGAHEVFIRLIHPDPVLLLRYGRLIKKRTGARLVASLDGADAVGDTLSAGPLLAESLAEAVLVLPRTPENRQKPPREARPETPFQPPGEARDLDLIAGRTVERAKRILSMLGLRPKGYELISCPTCGRCGIDVEGLARDTDARMRALEAELGSSGTDFERLGGITVAVMGCNVNGPGEAKAADIGIAGGKNGRGTLFMKGAPVRTFPQEELVRALMDGVRAILEERTGSSGKTDTRTVRET